MIELAVLIVYLILMLLIGVYEYRKTKGVLDFYLAGRNLGVLLVSFSFFATYFSTAAFLGGGGFGFVAGFQWSAFLTFFHILFAIIAWLVIAPPMKRIAEKYGSLTIPGIFGMSFGRASQIVSAIVILVFFQFYMVSIYKGAGNLLEVMLGIDYKTALIITVAVVMIYTAIGGFRAVVVTDFIQGVLILAGGIALFVTLIAYLGGPVNAIESLKAAEIFKGSGENLFKFGELAPPPIMNAGMVIPFILSLTFAISIAQLASPQLVIRFVAAKDERVIRKGAILTPILIGIFALCVFSIGPFGWLIIPQYDDPVKYLKNSDLVIPFIAMKLFPAGINALLLTAIVAAAMSTINSLVHVIATTFTRDLIGSVVSVSEKTELLITRISVFAFALIPMIFAINPPDIIVVIVGLSFSVITSAFLIPLLSALYDPEAKEKPALASMIVSVAVCILWYMYFYRTYWVYPVIPGVLASIIVYGVTAKVKRVEAVPA
ncbi:transporter, SSS family [Archaeoglobus sulfaticallidus PM70-1]|uniref:Transporter, SSS family n=1 Tax=Archaeoglobus sulfaticallidus PM70-1 TaxID=387631 RepID=N0BLM7_9EURY|nr:sodium/solute symporter [Archaeoglobus sulfaticallidus]AGK61125.1 transporter, SSS family [Archaeoglobus sulfaticallidus PM70-1]